MDSSAAAERARIVAWLRSQTGHPTAMPSYWARRIEDGDHESASHHRAPHTCTHGGRYLGTEPVCLRDPEMVREPACSACPSWAPRGGS